MTAWTVFLDHRLAVFSLPSGVRTGFVTYRREAVETNVSPTWAALRAEELNSAPRRLGGRFDLYRAAPAECWRSEPPLER